MAKKTDTPEGTVPETVKTEAVPQTPVEAVYTAAEFARNAARLFGDRATADIVTAAFRVNGKETATLTEARRLVEQFMSKEVR